MFSVLYPKLCYIKVHYKGTALHLLKAKYFLGYIEIVSMVQWIKTQFLSNETIIRGSVLGGRLNICLFVLLLYVPSQQLRSWRDGQFT